MKYPQDFIDKIICADCLKAMKDIPDSTIDLVVTSPPYNIGKDYGKQYSDNLSKSEYTKLINGFVKEMKRVLKEDGRFAINLGNWLPVIEMYSPLFMSRILDKHKLKTLEVITWIKTRLNKYVPIFGRQAFCGCNTAWGSYLSAKHPSIRSHSEAIIIGYNRQFAKKSKGKSDISKNEFLEYTQNVWFFPPDAKRQKLHSCPYPEELVYRVIKLFSYVDDLVLDPFNGIGATTAVCKANNRRFIGIEINPEYCKIANQRLNSLL